MSAPRRTAGGGTRIERRTGRPTTGIELAPAEFVSCDDNVMLDAIDALAAVLSAVVAQPSRSHQSDEEQA